MVQRNDEHFFTDGLGLDLAVQGVTLWPKRHGRRFCEQVFDLGRPLILAIAAVVTAVRWRRAGGKEQPVKVFGNWVVLRPEDRYELCLAGVAGLREQSGLRAVDLQRDADLGKLLLDSGQRAQFGLDGLRADF